MVPGGAETLFSTVKSGWSMWQAYSVRCLAKCKKRKTPTWLLPKGAFRWMGRSGAGEVEAMCRSYSQTPSSALVKLRRALTRSRVCNGRYSTLHTACDLKKVRVDG